MKNRKRYIISGFILLIIFIIVLSFRRENNLPRIIPSNQNNREESISIEKEIPVKEKNIKENIPLVSDIKILDSKNIQVSLEVSGSFYKTEIREGLSVFDAMQKIKENKENLFDFKYKETPGLGNFVTEINGSKGSPGKYWIYYVNNEKATIGASKYILKSGDIIKWSQEGL